MKAIAVEADVTDSASVARMAATLRKRCGHIHILVNNAGASFGVPADILSYDEAAWIRTVDVCLFSVFRVSRAVLPLMLGEPGAIVNTASRAGKVPPLFNSAYAAAKAGVIMLTKTMARELAPHGIRVNAICPGQIRTDLEQWRFGLEASFFGGTVEEQGSRRCARRSPSAGSALRRMQGGSSPFSSRMPPGTSRGRRSTSTAGSAWSCDGLWRGIPEKSPMRPFQRPSILE